jgi:hypothetical protein
VISAPKHHRCDYDEADMAGPPSPRIFARTHAATCGGNSRHQTRPMSFFIERISETADRPTRKRLPGDYGDKHAAERAVEMVVRGYKSHGRNDEQGYWWGRDYDGAEFKFVISGST